MGKVGRLHNRVEPFAVLFWAFDLARWPEFTSLEFSTSVHQGFTTAQITVNLG